METIAMIAALVSLLITMSGFMLSKRALARARKADSLSRQQPMRSDLNGHSSIRQWRRAADESKMASERRRDG